ncbi:MAG: TonB-dependent receptor [Acidobacteria bacterium]|nr:TonB-dependent receptor [Acidobacteriota bacterium]
MKLRLVAIFVLVILAATTLMAQTFRGTILGTVTDASGAVVSGATVKVRNVGTGQERTTTTSADGSYAIPELPIGTYSVSVTQSGFQTAVANNVEVGVGGERRVDALLKTGDVSVKVEVAGDLLPQVETTSAELGGTLTSDTIKDIPVNGRDYTKLIYLNPGIAGSPDQISDSPGSFGTFSMNGSRGRANNFLLDGTDMNDGYRNDPAINEPGVFGDPATILPIDAIAELRVLSNGEAEYGRNSGAVVNIVTKSGTNQWHGSVMEYNRTSSVGGARNYFNNVDAQDPFHNNQFGGSFGGPIVKDKTFFYANYEGQRESGAQSGTSCVPDPRQIAADISDLAINGGEPFPNPIITALLARNPWPTPNRPDPLWDGSSTYETGCRTDPGTGATINNLASSTPFKNRVDSLIAKVDHNFNPNNLLTGRYYFGDSDQSFPFAQLAGGLLPGFNTVTPTRVQLVSLSWVKVMNANQVNEARLGWNRFAEGFFPEDQSFDPTSIGLNTGVGKYEGGLPAINVGDFSQIGATNGVPRNRVDSNWHFIDNYSWKAGRHDVKFGYELRRTTIMQVLENTFRGKLSFGDLTSFLQGQPSDGGQRTGNTRRHTSENSHAFYVQDSFRWTPRLTLNVGLRWDYFGVVNEKSNLFYRFDPATQTEVQTGQLYNKDYNNFAPRIALAYDVTGKGKTVIRGGAGMYYDAFAQDIFLGHFPWNCFFCPGPAYPGVGPAAISGLGLRLDPNPPNNPLPLDSNFPVYDTAGASPNGEFFGADPKMRTPYVMNFNLNLQQSVGNRAVVQVGYVGTKGTKLFRFRDINQPTEAQITAADLACEPDPDNGSFCPSGYGVPRAFQDALPFYINQEETAAGSIYHALQASLRLNSWHGLNSQVNFVWSHAIDDASDSEDFTPNQAQPQNSAGPSRLDRGNSSFDIRRRLTWNFAYDLPKFGGSMSRLKNGWGIDGVLSLQDGQPFHLNYLFEGDYSGAGQGFDRPDVIGPIHYGSLPNNFLDLRSFAAPCTWGNTPNDGSADETNCVPGTRHFGNEGRNSLRGPTFKEFNFSISKNTSITEKVNLNLRAEFFNMLNHPNFSNPLLPVFAADIGNPGADGTHAGSVYSLTATGDVGIGNPFLGGGGPRGVQFAAKITF